jgi:hypothetical protein
VLRRGCRQQVTTGVRREEQIDTALREDPNNGRTPGYGVFLVALKLTWSWVDCLRFLLGSYKQPGQTVKAATPVRTMSGALVPSLISQKGPIGHPT